MTFRNNSAPAARFFPRFTLRTVFIVGSFLSLLVWHIITMRELTRVQRENREVRHQAGLLTVSDPTRVHAMAVPTVEDHTWRWRIYIPDAEKYRLCTRFVDLPQDTVPKPHFRIDLEPGNQVITATMRLNGTKPVLKLGSEFRISTLPLSDASVKFFSRDTGFEWHQAGERASELAASGDPMVLLRHRRTLQVGKAHTVNMNPTDGLMIWIEPR